MAIAMMEPRDAKRWVGLERVMRGVANRRRIKALFVLSDRPGLTLGELARACGMSVQNATEQTRRMVNADLIQKHRQAQTVRHALTPTGESVLAFLQTFRPTTS